MSNTFLKDNKQRAAIYCRVSTEEQDNERQIRDLESFAERRGFEVVQIFQEQASGKSTDRLQRRLLIQLARQRKIDIILVTELTRWGRSTTDLLSTLQELNSYGVSLIAEKGDQMDLSTAQGKMIAGVLAVLAQFERDLISERTRSGLALAKAKGKQLGRPKGNKTDSKHRKAILELHQAGFTYREIASKLKISKDTIQRVVKH